MFKTRTDHWSHLLFPSYTAKHAMLHSASHASAQQKLAEPKTLQGVAYIFWLLSVPSHLCCCKPVLLLLSLCNSPGSPWSHRRTVMRVSQPFKSCISSLVDTLLVFPSRKPNPLVFLLPYNRGSPFACMQPPCNLKDTPSAEMQGKTEAVSHPVSHLLNTLGFAFFLSLSQ